MDFMSHVTWATFKFNRNQLGAVSARVDQNTDGTLLEFPVRTAMHGKSRVSSAISVCDN